jgi:catechol 2,3-dioxygenase-like lactoylglutathione lyase family enzyme
MVGCASKTRLTHPTNFHEARDRPHDGREDLAAGIRRGEPMSQSIGYVTLVVRDYDEAIAFYVDVLGFRLVEDRYIAEQDKRWVLVAPAGPSGTCLLLARAVGPEQTSRVGRQTGGRVFLFLHTDDFWRDYESYKARGVTFVREPKEESYGTVAVFQDLYGNLWDLLKLRDR